VNTFEQSDEVQLLKDELKEANTKYIQFKDVCQRAFAKMKEIEQDLTRTKKELSLSSRKRDEYKENLRDVITQYKELHKEHEIGVEQMKVLQEKVRLLEEEKSDNEGRTSEIMEAEGLSDNVDDLTAAYRRAGAMIASLERKLASAELEAEAAEKQKDKGNRKMRDAVATRRKLELEKENLERRVAESEDKLRLMRLETTRHKEEAKHVRRRLTQYMRDGTSVEPPIVQIASEFDVAPNDTFEEEFDERTERQPWTEEMAHRVMLIEAAVTGKERSARTAILLEKERLESENTELKAFCEELLTQVIRKQ